MTPARYLNATAVAEYLSISRGTVDQLVRDGVIPKPIGLTKRLLRWDRQAIDAKLAGDGAPLAPQTASEICRGIADGIIAERRLPPAKASRQRHRGNILPLARDRGEDRG